jgi:glycosyltransferase involved in cell wall biosynthesis
VTEAPRPLVTAVVPTYNRALVRRAVESVLKQSYGPIELVVVDDHSPEPATNHLAGLPTDSVAEFRVVRHETNQGGSAARNTGIEEANGEYVAFDDDDRWLPERIERTVEAFERDREVGFVYCDVYNLREDGREYHGRCLHDDFTAALSRGNVVGSTSAVAVRTSLARRVRLDESMPAWQDLDWYLRLSLETKFAHVPEALVEYDFTSDGRVSEDFDRAQRAYEQFVEKHAELAESYGWLFERRFRAWSAFRVGAAGFNTDNFAGARPYFRRAVHEYPLESKFWEYLLATVGGERTARLARLSHRHLRSLQRG